MSSCCHAVLQVFDSLNRRILYSVYSNSFWLFEENVAEFHSCALEIMPFFATLYAFCVTRGHAISTLARRFRQMLRDCGKSDIFEII